MIEKILIKDLSPLSGLTELKWLMFDILFLIE
jgi:hypothetical protein